MIVRHGDGKTKEGPGVLISLTGDEVAVAINAYLAAHRVYVFGPKTVRVNSGLCRTGEVYVDPSGYVMDKGIRMSGDGGIDL
jgi:hypothetical protein